MSWPNSSVMVMPLLDLFAVSFRLALSKLFPTFCLKQRALGCCCEGEVGWRCLQDADRFCSIWGVTSPYGAYLEEIKQPRPHHTGNSSAM